MASKVELLKVALAVGALSCAQACVAVPVTTLELVSTSSGVQPFTAGLAFAKGEVPIAPVLALSDAQVIVKTRWNDGSVKFAITSGHTTLTANQPLSVVVDATTTPPTGTPLTAANIQAANPAASVTLAGIGTVSLSSLLATPMRTWISGPEMVEAHYRGRRAATRTWPCGFTCATTNPDAPLCARSWRTATSISPTATAAI